MIEQDEQPGPDLTLEELLNPTVVEPVIEPAPIPEVPKPEPAVLEVAQFMHPDKIAKPKRKPEVPDPMPEDEPVKVKAKTK